jgi:hypothetical protein
MAAKAKTPASRWVLRTYSIYLEASLDLLGSFFAECTVVARRSQLDNTRRLKKSTGVREIKISGQVPGQHRSSPMAEDPRLMNGADQ